MANMARTKNETVEYIIFIHEEIDKAEEFTGQQITYSEESGTYDIDFGYYQMCVFDHDVISKDKTGKIQIWKYPEFAKLFEKFDPSEDGEKKDGRRTGRRSLPDSDHRARTEGKVLFRSGTRIDA